MLSIGVDIGGTKVAAGVVAPDGTVVEKVVRPTPASTPAAVEDAIVETVDQLRAQHTAAAVGIGAAGWVDSEQARVRFSPTWPGATNRYGNACGNGLICP